MNIKILSRYCAQFSRIKEDLIQEQSSPHTKKKKNKQNFKQIDENSKPALRIM